ncbi:MAG: hypothetical protein ACQGVC_09040 [Myxococcota bacterium]
MRHSSVPSGLGSLVAAALLLLGASAGADARHDTSRHARASRVVVSQDGYGFVRMGRDCRVFFDARGGQTSHQGHCSGRQMWMAGQAWQASLHERSFRRGPRVFRGHDGYGYVAMDRGCRVFFDARGDRTSHQGRCSSRQMWRAAEVWGSRLRASRW